MTRRSSKSSLFCCFITCSCSNPRYTLRMALTRFVISQKFQLEKCNEYHFRNKPPLSPRKQSCQEIPRDIESYPRFGRYSITIILTEEEKGAGREGKDCAVSVLFSHLPLTLSSLLSQSQLLVCVVSQQLLLFIISPSMAPNLLQFERGKVS